MGDSVAFCMKFRSFMT